MRSSEECHKEFRRAIAAIDADCLKVTTMRAIVEAMTKCPTRVDNGRLYLSDGPNTALKTRLRDVVDYRKLDYDLEQRARRTLAHEGPWIRQVLRQQLPFWQQWVYPVRKMKWRASNNYLADVHPKRARDE